MSGLIIIRALLTQTAPLVALVPATQIAAGVMPQNSPLPAIALTDISSTDRTTLRGQAVVKVTERVQITVIAKTLPELKTVMAAVRHACRNRVGNLAGFAGSTCRLDGKGPDFSDAEAQFCMQTQDTLVTFNEVA